MNADFVRRSGGVTQSGSLGLGPPARFIILGSALLYCGAAIVAGGIEPGLPIRQGRYILKAGEYLNRGPHRNAVAYFEDARHGRVNHDVQALRAAAHDAVHLREQGPIRLPDPDIVAKAAQEQRVVLTFDLDFGDISPWRAPKLPASSFSVREIRRQPP